MNDASRSSDSGEPGDRPTSIVPFTARRRTHTVPPAPPTRLVGRAAEIDTALDALCRDNTRLLTLTGPGGIGKTRLALEIANRCSPAFPDGVVWVPLAPVGDPDLLVPALETSLGIADMHRAATMAPIISALRSQSVLLILDNFEQILTAAPRLTEVLRSCPGVSMLVTSRAPLRISDERLLPLRPLGLPRTQQDILAPAELRDVEAVRLFVDRATNVSPSFVLDQETAPLVAHICQRLDGLPLAIELAAARVHHLSIQTLHDRLERRLPLLTGGPLDLPARQHTLRNTIAWSHDLLTPEEQALFCQLAVFMGGFALEDAESVCDDRDTVLDRLTALVDKSLVQLAAHADGARYLMLETIHEYALEALTTSGDEARIRQRHAAHVLQRVNEEGPELAWGAIGGWGDDLDADHDNFRAALSWLAQSGQWQECLRLATALSGFWDARGQIGEGRTWLTLALDPARTGDAPTPLRAGASATLGLFVLRHGDLDLAEPYLEEARAAWLSVGDTNGLAFTTMVLGGLAEYRGDDAQAQPLYEQALALFREAGHLPGIAMTLNNLADTAYRCGNFVQAESLAKASIAVSREANQPILTCNALITVGAAACMQGDLRRAHAALHEALHTSRDGGYQLTLTDTIVGLADVATASGDPLRAARLLGGVERLAESLGVPRLEHGALHRNAVAATRSQLDEAAFVAAWEAGRSLSTGEILADAEAVSPGPRNGTPVRLTRREREVLNLLVAGNTDRAIAEALFIGTRTVESHVARIFEKLRVRTRAAAVSTAIATGLAVPPPPEDR